MFCYWNITPNQIYSPFFVIGDINRVHTQNYILAPCKITVPNPKMSYIVNIMSCGPTRQGCSIFHHHLQIIIYIYIYIYIITKIINEHGSLYYHPHFSEMIPFRIDSRRRREIKIDWNINRGLKQDKSYVELYGKTSGLIGFLYVIN